MPRDDDRDDSYTDRDTNRYTDAYTGADTGPDTRFEFDLDLHDGGERHTRLVGFACSRAPEECMTIRQATVDASTVSDAPADVSDVLGDTASRDRCPNCGGALIRYVIDDDTRWSR